MPKTPRHRLKLLRFRSATLPKNADVLPMQVVWPDGRIEWVYSIEGQSAN